ncbi:MAG: efflux RND transporter periplasmic adaptor subunit [Acidocella sp.]|nr:efflux RND transporter periplasmic adaptor subunit [Acidocella sp.]
MFALAALLPGCNKKQEAAPPPVQVGVITVHTQPVTRTTELPGRTSSFMISDVRPQVDGVILKRLFVEGSDVKEGQPLYQIDPRPYQAVYDSDVATLAHAEAALATANAKLERYKPLAAAQAVSQQDYDDAQASALESKADIASARAAIESAAINLRYTKVLSPITGTIGASSVTEGALVTASQTTALATVTTLDPIYVDVNESSATMLRLKQEMAAGQLDTQGDGTAKVKLVLEDGSTYPIIGKLQFSQVYVDEGTGTVMLRAIFPNPQHLLLPGMYVHAELEEGVNTNGIEVPQKAVSHNTHGDATVLVVGADNKAETRVIQTGPAIGQNWVVTGGLKVGEKVVIDGLMNVRPGMTVTPVPEDKPAASGTTN